MEDIEGHVESYDLGKRNLADEIASLESEEAVERQLAELKARRAGTSKSSEAGE
jgi:phage shock protein A